MTIQGTKLLTSQCFDGIGSRRLDRLETHRQPSYHDGNNPRQQVHGDADTGSVCVFIQPDADTIPRRWNGKQECYCDKTAKIAGQQDDDALNGGSKCFSNADLLSALLARKRRERK